MACMVGTCVGSALLCVTPVEAAPALYRSELTNEWISSSIQTQRPIAAMVDNEKIALPHYGLSTADVVYEMTNSLKNEGVTRFMVLQKDWGNIQRMGSIRSVRPANLQIAPEWNAVVCHDGGPFYIKPYLDLDYVDNFSGSFSRIKNGKPREFTEYISPGNLSRNFAASGYTTQYNGYYQGAHYLFAPQETPVNLAATPGNVNCTRIDLPYQHNKPYLEYNPATGLYGYNEYGKPHLDPGNNNAQMSFRNLLIQNTVCIPLDANGYMTFQMSDANRSGYYITGGKAIAVTWAKANDITPTRYYDATGKEIVLNTGKTYVAIVPSDLWANISIR